MMSESKEDRIKDILMKTLEPTKLEIIDKSGGCGAMFDIFVESSVFKGKPLIAQHKLVTKALEAEIKEIHGFTIKTKISD